MYLGWGVVVCRLGTGGAGVWTGTMWMSQAGCWLTWYLG